MIKPELVDNLRTLTRPKGSHRLVLLKPFPPQGLYGLQIRIYHAWLVLTGQATAIVFDEDL